MPDAAERMRILRMIRDHEITAEEGAKLLGGSGETGTPGPARQHPADGKCLRITAADMASRLLKASVRVPIGLHDAGTKIGVRFSPEVEGINMAQVMDATRAGVSGKVIDVADERAGEHIEIHAD
jgi:hypothetical protein